MAKTRCAVALKRQELIAATIGPQGEGEMRLDPNGPGHELWRRDAANSDAVKAQGSPGQRVVFDSVTDQGAEAVQAALSEWRPGDAQIVATAGALKASSKLRKLFEGAKAAGAVAIYDDPPTQQEIEAETDGPARSLSDEQHQMPCEPILTGTVTACWYARRVFARPVVRKWRLYNKQW